MRIGVLTILAGLVLMFPASAFSKGEGVNEGRSETGKAWGETSLIASGDGLAEGVRVAMDASGNAVAVWMQIHGNAVSMWASRYAAKPGKWGSTTRLKGIAHEMDSQLAGLVMDPKGNAVALWTVSGTKGNAIWAARYAVADNKWTVKAIVEHGDAHTPSIAMSDNGNAMAAWVQSDGKRDRIWASRQGAGNGKWGKPVPIDNGEGYVESVKIASDAKGNAIAIWQQWQDSGYFNIYANRFSAVDGRWGEVDLVGTDTGVTGGWPDVAMNADGNAIVVWEKSQALDTQIFARSFKANTAQWSNLGKFEITHSPFALQLAMDKKGNALVVWLTTDHQAWHAGVWSNRYLSSNGGWSKATLLDENNERDAEWPQIAMDANGNALVLWDRLPARNQQDDKSADILAYRYASDGASSAKNDIVVKTPASAGWPSPALSMEPGGNAIAVWHLYDGKRSMIMANHYR